MPIHSTAIVDPGAQLGAGVEILPYTIIEGDVQIGDNCVLGPHAVIRSHTTVGENCHISTGAVLGEPPQDRKFKGEVTFLRLGRDNEIREYVTLHRATGEGNSTVIGDHNVIMAYCHAGHNTQIGNHCQMANGVQISGHCIIEDYVTIGGMTGFHQFVTVGKVAMIGGMSRITRDVPPFVIVEGNPAREHGLNVIGLERRGVSPESRAALRQAHRLAFRSGHNLNEALVAIREQLTDSAEVVYLCDFLERTVQGASGRQMSRH